MGLRGPLPRQAKTQGRGANLVTKVPRPPAGLGPVGRREWQRVGAELGPKGRNVLTESVLGLLEDLARSLDDAEAFRSKWQKEGMTVEGRGREFPHPMIIAERESRARAHQLRRELGVTPSSVVRVPDGPKEAEGPKDEWE